MSELKLREDQRTLEGRIVIWDPMIAPSRAFTARVQWQRSSGFAQEHLGFVRLPALERGGTASVQFGFRIPVAAQPGRRLVFVCAHDLDARGGPAHKLGCIRAGVVNLTAQGRTGSHRRSRSSSSPPLPAAASPAALPALLEPPSQLASAAPTDSIGAPEPFPAETVRAETASPEVAITAGPSGAVVEGPATVVFHSSQPGGRLECSLDGALFTICTSPFITPLLPAGLHRFTVRVAGSLGVATVASASIEWLVIPRRVNLCGRIERDEVLGPRHAAEYVIDHCQATIVSGVGVTLEPGSVIRSLGGRLVVQGEMRAEGEPAQPVLFSSLLELESAGGSVPAAGDWQGIEVAAGGSADLQATTIKYAAKALAVAPGAEVTIHGSILDSTVGISAETWVDATGIYWGSASGPAPAGSGPTIEGDGPMVVPWVGWMPEQRPTLEPEPEQPEACTPSSPGVLFVGLRGSGESPQGFEEYGSAAAAGLGGPVAAALSGFSSRLSEVGSAGPVSVLGLRYPALALPEAVPVDELLGLAYAEYERSYWQGAVNLAGLIREEEARCPKRRIVLAGYSQGALGIHLALTELLSASELSDIAALILISDPANRGADPAVLQVGGAPSSAEGLYARAFAGTADAAQPLPATLAGHAIELCHEADLICAPAPDASMAEHDDYVERESEAVGSWAAEHLAPPAA